MKDFIEEYGGVVVACLMGLVILGIVVSLLSSDGALHDLVAKFFYGIGATSR